MQMQQQTRLVGYEPKYEYVDVPVTETVTMPAQAQQQYTVRLECQLHTAERDMLCVVSSK